ncbi:MAG TPA: fatty acid desaturase [Aliidongia sp.]|nr:fatty acid desaturase [Aliidongia sp.]
MPCPGLAEERSAIVAALGHFQNPSVRRGLTQFATTILGYLALVAIMFAAFDRGIWAAAILVVPAAGFVVRLFIIQHDCGHRSYFRSQRANAIVGWLCSLVTLTPYASWRRQHSRHHAVWNNLDYRRDATDIYATCLTLGEYRELSTVQRWLYRAVRHPVIAHFILPPLVFLLLYRIPFDTPATWSAERRSVYFTNATFAVMLAVLIALLGWKPVLFVQISTIALSSITGVWLFAVQHKFEDAEWMRQPQWTPLRAALSGTSYLKLPPLLQWFTGNIGFHHVHHLLPRVPNYRLEDCHKALLALTGGVRTITLAEALVAPSFALWDEAGGRMVPFPR